MKRRKIYNIAVLFLTLLLSANNLLAQDRNVQEMSKNELMELTYDDLLDLSFEDLMFVANKFELSAEELMEFFINKDVSIASKKSEGTLEAPLSTTVLTGEEIRQSGAISIAEVFRLVPGFIVREKTTGNFDVHIRGNDNMPPANMMTYSENVSTLVMIDNRITFCYTFGGTFWESFPIDILDIERIEIVRGPSAPLYGPNAVSGVINIVTKKPEDNKLRVNADAQGGSLNTLIGNLGVSKGFDNNLSVRVSGNYRLMDRYQDDFYMFPFDGYYPLDSIAAPNRENFGLPVKPDTTPQGYYPNPLLAQDNYGVNAFVFYDPAEDINFHLSAGLQRSEVISSMVDDSYIATARREIESKYVNFNAKLKDFIVHTSYHAGLQDNTVGSKGFRLDFGTLHSGIEYDFNKIENLSIRPGISYQQAFNDDSDYLVGQNMLMGKKELNYLAWSLRADYTLFDRLRLIGAVRQDFYNHPSEPYLSYQGVVSFKINDKNHLRYVYSKSNNSPFIMPTYTNYDWQKFAPGTPTYPPGLMLRFDGATDLDLITMDMHEIGYRTQLVENVQIEFELFQTTYQNIIAFMPDSVYLMTDPTNPALIYDSNPVEPSVQPIPTRFHFNYENLDAVSKQTGATMNVKVALSDKASFRVFGTYQQTKLDNYYPLTTEEIIKEMITEVVTTNYGPLLMGSPTPGPITYGTKPDTLMDTVNVATPEFYGGASGNYLMLHDKLNINLGIYFYSKQTYIHKYGSFDIEPKVLLNTKIAYKFWRENSIYINVRNLLNNHKQEFGFLDQNGLRILGGISLSF